MLEHLTTSDNIHNNHLEWSRNSNNSSSNSIIAISGWRKRLLEKNRGEDKNMSEAWIDNSSDSDNFWIHPIPFIASFVRKTVSVGVKTSDRAQAENVIKIGGCSCTCTHMFHLMYRKTLTVLLHKLLPISICKNFYCLYCTYLWNLGNDCE